jgi:hypothetical protein
MARLAEALGEKSLAAGHKVSTRDQFQRASHYYRISLIPTLPDDPRMKEKPPGFAFADVSLRYIS